MQSFKYVIIGGGVAGGKACEGSFAVYHFWQGALCGVLTAGRPAEERKPMQVLVRARAAYDHVAVQLADETTDLNALAA